MQMRLNLLNCGHECGYDGGQAYEKLRVRCKGPLVQGLVDNQFL
jgi:hypothetical protein